MILGGFYGSWLFCGSYWFLVVLVNFRGCWCLFLFVCVCWGLLVVVGDSWWFLVVLGGYLKCLVVLDCSWWFLVV